MQFRTQSSLRLWLGVRDNTGLGRYRRWSGTLCHIWLLNFVFLKLVNIWNVNCARETGVFSTHELMWKCQSFWDRKCLDLKWTRTPNLQIHAECSNHLSYQGQTFAAPCFFKTSSSCIVIFEVKLTFERLTAHGQQYSFSTHERMFMWKCQSYWHRKSLNLRWARTPNLRIHAECSSHLSYQGTDLLSHGFEHWIWWYRYIWSKVNIWSFVCMSASRQGEAGNWMYFGWTVLLIYYACMLSVVYSHGHITLLWAC